ncbi:DNA-binding response regulator [Halobacillus andaensis]|uniref:DNA-binding response regulator n=1 Tax=Halobacillus andaensis TaxID=1176239 RepID=A0A917EX83_HALAA|nr:response regulator transcription factor [Halobacillus andaensis]MBP2006524.1 DNA-binding NarL/FixJ family response regulator [Halobacillus andaensis]GGF28027.1 DNA-binding response regulator [Halobacillus andaensis]
MIKLLIVEDQALTRESLKIILDMDEHIEVIGQSEDGEEAIEFCVNNKPDLILMDIHMPNMDGVTATKAIKERWPEIKIIMLTTFEETNYVIQALKSGAEGYLLKAILPEDLILGIRLVNKGGTLIPQGIAQTLLSKLPEQNRSPQNHQVKNDKILTPREVEVLYEVSLGLTNKDIAEKLFLTEGTVKNYISTIYSKLEVKDRINAVKAASEKNLI